MKAKLIPALIVVTVLALLAGFMISVQINTQQLHSSDLAAQDTESLVAIIRESNEKRIALEKQYLATSESVKAMEAQTLTSAEALARLTEESEGLSLINGVSPVTGPGVSVRLETSDKLVSTDLVDMVNELWGAGAEAIAVNSIRVTNESSFSNVVKDGEVILRLGDKTLTQPITVYAVGSSENLETGLTFPGGLVDSMETLFGIQVSITREASLTLPAADTK